MENLQQDESANDRTVIQAGGKPLEKSYEND